MDLFLERIMALGAKRKQRQNVRVTKSSLLQKQPVGEILLPKHPHSPASARPLPLLPPAYLCISSATAAAATEGDR